MDGDCFKRARLVQNLRRALPLSAFPRPALIAFLRARGFAGRETPRLVVLDVFDAGAAGGLMCRFAIANDGKASALVAPLAQIALERRFQKAESRVARRRQAPPPDAA